MTDAHAALMTGPLMIDVAGLTLDDEDRRLLRHPAVGGVILFSRNYRDPAQLRALCEEIRALRQPRLLLAVDHEGGRVQRFREGFSAIPPMRQTGELCEADAAAALDQAHAHGLAIGRELVDYGIDLCFAPVLDRDCGVSSVIGDRAFAEDADTIVALATAFRAGLNAAGMAATGKHFPGHGAVAPDSHLELPEDPRSLEEIRSSCMRAFAGMIARGLESVMTAHVRYPQVDMLPASFSPRWLQQELRQELGFRGVIFSDDLSMKGAAEIGGPVARARAALDAGSDMVLICNDRPAVIETLEALGDARLSADAAQRLMGLYAGG
jgi:beta-N-acetylhexosaminidase